MQFVRGGRKSCRTRTREMHLRFLGGNRRNTLTQTSVAGARGKVTTGNCSSSPPLADKIATVRANSCSPSSARRSVRHLQQFDSKHRFWSVQQQQQQRLSEFTNPRVVVHLSRLQCSKQTLSPDTVELKPKLANVSAKTGDVETIQLDTSRKAPLPNITPELQVPHESTDQQIVSVKGGLDDENMEILQADGERKEEVCDGDMAEIGNEGTSKSGQEGENSANAGQSAHSTVERRPKRMVSCKKPVGCDSF